MEVKRRKTLLASLPCEMLRLAKTVMVFLTSLNTLFRKDLKCTAILIGFGLASVTNLPSTSASLIPISQQIPSSSSVAITKIESNNKSEPYFIEFVQPNNTNSNTTHPRRLTKLPNGHSKLYERKMRKAPESAMNRARLLLGSLNRQNCFAKVLCGLGAREPTTKTDIFNDYVYLMEELVVDDDDDEAEKTKPKAKGKGKKWGKDKKHKKVHTKKEDDSDSSQSKSEEKKPQEDIDDKLTDWNFLADSSLAQEDPQVLKYVQLEEKRRQYKDQLPNDILLKRMDQENSRNKSRNLDNENPIQLQLPPKSTLRLARKMATSIRKGKTFSTRRQCRKFRTFLRDRCPFDDIQMNEIISNLRKMLTGQGQVSSSVSKTTTTVTANGAADGQVKAISQPGGGGSKVEIILHLNQNGMPYGGYHPMQYPQMPSTQQFTIPASTSQPRPSGSSSTVTLAPPLPPWPQLQLGGGSSDPRYPNNGMGYSYYTTPPTTTTTTTTEPTTTTVRSAGEEQLLDFLYGVVNFNESESNPAAPTPEVKQQNPQSSNPYWSVANSALDKLDDVEHQLKIRDRENDDDDSRSKSSEEDELKSYIKSLKETLKGFSQMSNITLLADQTSPVVGEKSSEEDNSSQDDFGVLLPETSDEIRNGEDSNGDDDESDENSQQEDSIVNNLTETTTKPPPLTLIAFPTLEPTLFSTTTIRPPKEELLFDEDTEDNSEKQFGRDDENTDDKEDDEYEPEYASASAEDDENQDDSSENSENSPLVSRDDENGDVQQKSVERNSPRPPSILLKFEPIPAEKDPEEMSAKEKSKLIALSNALLPPVADTQSSTPNRKPVQDIMEEILIPTAKPVLNVFQSVSKIVKSEINIDEFADDSGKSPKFPKKKKKKGSQQKLRYQNRRRSPLRKPLFQSPDPETQQDSISTDDSSDEADDDYPHRNRGDLNSDEFYNNGTKSKNGPLISIPRFPQSSSQQSSQIYHNLMNLMGMRPVGKEITSLQEQQQSIQSQYGYGSKEIKSAPQLLSPSENSFTKNHLVAQPKIGISIPLGFDMMGRDGLADVIGTDAPSTTTSTTTTTTTPKNVKGDLADDEDDDDDHSKESKESKECKKKKDKKKKDKKKKDKKKKDKKKKDKKKKDKKKKKKKKGKKHEKSKKGESSGYAMQFHQHVHPGEHHAEPNLWEKIKVFVDALASTQQGAGEMPFIHVGFSESDPLDGGPHAVIGDGQHSAPPSEPYHHSYGDDSDEDSEEEEDDIGNRPPPRRRRPPPPSKKRPEFDPENSAPVSSAEYEGIDYDESGDDSNEDIVEEPSSKKTYSNATIGASNNDTSFSPLLFLPPITQAPTSPTPPTTTQKTTIAPKPPKYTVNRQQLKIKNKRKKQNQTLSSSTIGPPIMLFVTSTEEPAPSTTTQDPLQPIITTKPPKRRVIYKPPPKRVTTLHGATHFITTTIKPSTSSLKSFPPDMIKTRVEDDEVEPPSHFFQPGPNGMNVRGRLPVPIDAFHIQSEDMLTDVEDDDRPEEKFRAGIKRPTPPFGTYPYGIDRRTSQEDEKSSKSRPPVLIVTPKPSRPLHTASIIGNPEEMRGGTRARTKHKKTKRPHHHQHHLDKVEDDSKITSSIMNSPIFSDYFKHLYTSFGQYMSTNG